MRKTLALMAALSIGGAAGAYAADMTMPVAPVSPAAPTSTPETIQAQSVNDLLIATPETTSFARLLKAAGQDVTLSTTGPYTVFAPVNDAFKALPPGKGEQLIQPSFKKEAELLVNSHIVAGKVTAADIPMGETSVPTLNGGTITLKKTAEGVWVNGAKLVGSDMMASNGVVHEISAIVSPMSTN